jgi:hypothetical protein
MTELERALVALGRELELPATPDLAAAVRPRLARRAPRWLVPALAALIALAVAFAVPPARSAILRLFHLRGAEVRLVERLPPLGRSSGLGVPIGAGAAAFDLLLLDGKPARAVYAAQGGYWLRYSGVLLFELGNGGGPLLKKVASTAAQVEYVDVGGDPGIWIGSGHAVYLPGGSARYSGHALVWDRGGLTLRLEAKVDRDAAIALALRVR